MSVFSSLSIAGGIVGFADVFKDDQKTLMIFEDEQKTSRNFQIKNLTAQRTANVRGEIVGGIIGYTSPTTDLENVKLRITVDRSENSLISKILSYNSYAGGIVGLGSGYFYRVTAEYDEVAQSDIEKSYPDYYDGITSGENFTRGNNDIFYSTYNGTISYDYKTQVIGGIVGVMINGEIDNSYSKINVIAKEESRTIAGGIIGRVNGKGRTYTFNIRFDEDLAISTSVRLKEVYASGDVRGGYVKTDSGEEFGFGGGIVGVIDRTSVVAFESVNAVNAFSYDNVAMVTVPGSENREGEMSSVGVYAFVGGTENDRGTIRIIPSSLYKSNGEKESAASSKSMGYFTYITNPSGEKINIKK